MILEEIIAYRREAIAERKLRLPLRELKVRIRDMDPPRDFQSAISRETTPKAISSASGGPSAIRLIAEIKRASPSKGVIREDFDVATLARSYRDGGAAAISVLTEERFFQGDLRHLALVREAANLPILRKDFIVNDYQIYEARAFGADALLLIVATLSPTELRDFLDLGRDLKLCCLTEVHAKGDLEEALLAGAEVIGINNRDLRTFQVSLETTLKLIKDIPKEKVVVSESGISSREDVLTLTRAGVDAILVGEALMRSPDVKAKLKELLENPGDQGQNLRPHYA